MEKCSERVESHYKSRLEDIKMLYSVANGNIPETEEVSSNSFWEYNLCLDFDCNLGCFRYLISTGGPSEEIRFYAVSGFLILQALILHRDPGNEVVPLLSITSLHALLSLERKELYSYFYIKPAINSLLIIIGNS